MYFKNCTKTVISKLNKNMLTKGAPLLLSVIPSLSKAFAVSSNKAPSSNSLLLFNSVYLSMNL